MTFRQEYENIIKNVDHSSFDSVADALENVLNLLQRQGNQEENQKDLQYVCKGAEILRDEGKSLVKNRKEEIIKEAKDNGISLSKIGISDENENTNEKK